MLPMAKTPAILTFSKIFFLKGGYSTLYSTKQYSISQFIYSTNQKLCDPTYKYFLVFPVPPPYTDQVAALHVFLIYT